MRGRKEHGGRARLCGIGQQFSGRLSLRAVREEIPGAEPGALAETVASVFRAVVRCS